jgi:hypothetical protein
MYKVMWGHHRIKRVQFGKGCVIEGQNDGIAQSKELWDECTVKLK